MVADLAAHRAARCRRRRGGAACARRALRRARRPAYRNDAVADQDWVRATQAQFQPIRIDDDLWIVPTWCEPPNADAVNITLDPGIAFGTGAHPSTRLCLAWLRAHRRAGLFGARLRVRFRHSRDRGGEARRRAASSASTSIRRRSSSSAANAAQNGVDATFVGVDALPAAAKFDSSSRTFSRTRCACSPPRSAGERRQAARSRSRAFSLRRPLTSSAAYAPWFDIASWRIEDDWVLLAAGAVDDAAAPDLNEPKLTRCPGCATVFRVTPAQLALRDGQVRCGHCRAVFDANDHFVSLDIVAPTNSAPTTNCCADRPTVTLRSADALLPVPAAERHAADGVPGADALRRDPLANQWRGLPMPMNLSRLRLPTNDPQPKSRNVTNPTHTAPPSKQPPVKDPPPRKSPRKEPPVKGPLVREPPTKRPPPKDPPVEEPPRRSRRRRIHHRRSRR